MVADSFIPGSKPVKLAFPNFRWVMLQVNRTLVDVEIKIFDVRGETIGSIKSLPNNQSTGSISSTVKVL